MSSNGMNFIKKSFRGWHDKLCRYLIWMIHRVVLEGKCVYVVFLGEERYKIGFSMQNQVERKVGKLTEGYCSEKQYLVMVITD